MATQLHVIVITAYIPYVLEVEKEKKNEHGRKKNGWGLCYKYKILFFLMFFLLFFQPHFGVHKGPTRM
jgi:cell division protein FtsW (lipid II flippase)